ncbi:hypothetical protein ACQKII_19150 [Lysinibacillus sp. NPDC048646]|uniref:hypothetical protein n=1 Tax=Lysinibacillus sp. NPDC048646 TaxID=3390574 RepID=UPI003D07B499
MEKFIGARIIANTSGELIAILHDISGEVLDRPDTTEIFAIDLPFGFLDDKKIMGVNPETKELIYEEIFKPLTPEEQKIKELEDELLLKADVENGGIL